MFIALVSNAVEELMEFGRCDVLDRLFVFSTELWVIECLEIRSWPRCLDQTWWGIGCRRKIEDLIEIEGMNMVSDR